MFLSTEVRNIVRALKMGHTNEEIAQILECDVESVEEFQDFQEPSTSNKQQAPPPRSLCGRPKVFKDRVLVEQMLQKYPLFTSIDIQHRLLKDYGISVSRRTLQRRISEIRNSANIPALTASKRRRLEWARAHKNWTVKDWRNIFNMDDTKFHLDQQPKLEIFEDTLIGPGDCTELSLLEQLMEIIGPKIETREPQNVQQFRDVLFELWHTDQELVDQIERLYESMPQRVAAVLLSNGNLTEISM